MTGIDKLIIKRNETSEYRNGIIADLDSITSHAECNGYSMPFPVNRLRRYTATFVYEGQAINGFSLEFIMHGTHGYIKSITLNPSHFNSYDSMFATLTAIVPYDILNGCRASRIDFAVDYNDQSYSEFISGFDVLRRSISTQYTHHRSGCPETLYFGSEKDILMVYDKREQQGGSIEQPLNRIERQLRSPSDIRNVFGEDITIENLREQLIHIVTGDVTPFWAVTLGSVQFASPQSLNTERNRERYYGFKRDISVRSYAIARRYVSATEKRNFSRNYARYHTRTLWEPCRQPDAVLREALCSYISYSNPRRIRSVQRLPLMAA